MNTLTTTLITRMVIWRAVLDDALNPARRGERGSASTDFALWAAAVVAIAAVVTAAIMAYVETQTAKLK